ncbi:MAG: NAD(P)H-dependent glycerol-3-phosphate dehydrogenase [Clostridia bacterium]|nr:NAD(P)H-dependent glycerol-3-phosphate dehydrogenase [Clostridia bacterium]
MSNTKKISVLGSGSWGTALSLVLADNGHDVTLWSFSKEEIKGIAENRENISKLPGVKLPESIKYSSNLEKSIEGKDIIVVAVPSAVIRGMAAKIGAYAKPEQIIVTVSKGIEEGTLMTQSQIMEDETNGNKVVALSGPSHAEEVGKRLPTTLISACSDLATAETVQDAFMNDYIRVYTSEDILGVELGGSLKNVIALAAGMCDGMGFGDNSKAALITRGIVEMSRLAIAMGAKQETLGGLSGIGDLIVTCESVHSRNRKAGFLMGQGMSMEHAMKEVNMVVEGVYSAKAALALGKKYNVSMPIIEQVNLVLFEDKDAKQAVYDLMNRDKKAEY